MELTTPSLTPLTNSFCSTVQAGFSLPAVREHDDSLNAPTWREIDGLRVAMVYPPGAREIKWCILTAPIDQPGFVFVAPNGIDLLRGLGGMVDGSVRLLKSRQDAEDALSAALYTSAPDEREFLNGVTIREVRVASDELSHRWIGSGLLRQRIFGRLAWSERLPAVEVSEDALVSA